MLIYILFICIINYYVYIYISVMKKGYRNHKKPHSEDCNSKIACYIKM